MCQVLKISRSGYYSWKQNGKSKRARQREQILVLVKDIYRDTKGLYGSPRITEALRRQGVNCNKKTVAKIMKTNGIRARTVKRYRSTTNSKHRYPIAENKLNQNFFIPKPNKVWLSDITYISTKEGWLYLAAILDLYSRRVIGWKLDKELHSDLVIKALKRALDERSIEEGVMFHSDQGFQYASDRFRKVLEHNGMIQSMCRKGNCYDNAVVESFFHTLKTEHVNFENYETRLEAQLSIFDYIEIFYNRKRLHSSIDYKSPVEYEELNL